MSTGYTLLPTNGCPKDYRGDSLHRGLLHSFQRREVLVWNLVFISPGGQFVHGYVVPKATRHISLKGQGGVSFFFKMESARPVPFLPHYYILTTKLLTHWKRPRCWEGLRAGGDGDGRGWDGWMASLAVDMSLGKLRSFWRTGRPGMLQSMESQTRVWHN